MPDYNHSEVCRLDSRGERLWRFGMRYSLPVIPGDGRDWFNAISTADELVHDDKGTEQAWGSAWVYKRDILFIMKSYGIYSEALKHISEKVDNALDVAGLATSQLIELDYSDPDTPLDFSEPPF